MPADPAFHPVETEVPSVSDGTAATTRELLASLVGSWTGTYRLWLEPDVLRIEGPTGATGRAVLDGRFVALDYDWVDVDGPQAGSILFPAQWDPKLGIHVT